PSGEYNAHPAGQGADRAGRRADKADPRVAHATRRVVDHVRGRPKAYRRGMVETHSGMEIERKYLLRSQPDLSAPQRVGAGEGGRGGVGGGEEGLIEQRYGRGGARLRRIETGGNVSYVETVKTGRGLVRDERERGLDRKEYKKLLEQADPERQTIRKRRLRFE